jgi:hypothetical protein
MIEEKKEVAEPNRPNLLLWLIGIVVFIRAPLIFAIYSIVVALGLNDHFIALIIALILGYTIPNWFDDLNDEVTEYINNKAK